MSVLNLVLIQDDTAGQRFSNLSQDDKRDVFTTINHALSRPCRSNICTTGTRKSHFLFIWLYDPPINRYRQPNVGRLFRTERFRTQLPKRPMVDHLPESVQEGAFNTMTIEEGGFNQIERKGRKLSRNLSIIM